MREIADRRRHGTTGETPLARFEREAGRLAACAGRPPFGQLRDLIRVVHVDCSVTVGTNAYSVPWRLIGERVRVVVSGSRVRVYHDRDVVAEHDEHHGRHERMTDRTHLEGINSGPLQGDVEYAAGRRRELLSMAVDYDVLVEHLTRMRLTCIRDQLDSLLDEAGEKQLTLRETVAFLVGREVSRKNERRLEMA